MPRPPIDVGQKIKDMLRHVDELPDEAGTPLAHYQRTITDLWNSLQYIERAFGQAPRYPTVARRHLGRLNAMILVNLIETFERFLKEIAAVVVDHLARHVLDDRFDEFSVHGSNLASYYGSGSLGKALCESEIWLKCKDINDRFRKLLADPFEPGRFYLFPGVGQAPNTEAFRQPILNLIWQVRHTMVHNVGVITGSDAIKIQLLAKQAVLSPRMLSPTRDDLRYLKRFLDETAQACNQRIGTRLAELLTSLHGHDATLLVPQETANAVSASFGTSLTVSGALGVP